MGYESWKGKRVPLWQSGHERCLREGIITEVSGSMIQIFAPEVRHPNGHVCPEVNEPVNISRRPDKVPHSSFFFPNPAAAK
jgi:hypothetical protein